MDEFPSNSKNPQRGKEPEKKIEAIKDLNVMRRKQPIGKRFLNTFVISDGRSVFNSVLFDVLIPSARDMIVDAGYEAIQRTFYGEGARGGRRRGGGAPAPGSYTNYTRYSSTGPLDPRADPRGPAPDPRKRGRGYQFDEIICKTRVEAEEIMDRLYDIVAKYEQASVKDLYELTNQPSDFTHDKWGWTDLRSAGIQRLPSGWYLLDLPRPEPLD